MNVDVNVARLGFGCRWILKSNKLWRTDDELVKPAEEKETLESSSGESWQPAQKTLETN